MKERFEAIVWHQNRCQRALEERRQTWAKRTLAIAEDGRLARERYYRKGARMGRRGGNPWRRRHIQESTRCLQIGDNGVFIMILFCVLSNEKLWILKKKIERLPCSCYKWFYLIFHVLDWKYATDKFSSYIDKVIMPLFCFCVQWECSAWIPSNKVEKIWTYYNFS